MRTCSSVLFGTSAATLAGLLESAAQELVEAKQLLLGETSDRLGYLRQNGEYEVGSEGGDEGGTAGREGKARL